MQTLTGLDILCRNGFNSLKGKRIGLVCNQSTVNHDYRHILDLLVPLHSAGELEVKIVFGPQHGLFGHTQDNMIEWEGSSENRWGIPIASLYGEHREPTASKLTGLDLFVIDLPDIGSRYYTFLWTTALCLKACERLGLPVLILDRPNPIGGLTVEGPVLDTEFKSFVGLYPLPTRHGMTLAEVATYLQQRYFPKVDLRKIQVEGWSRSDLGCDVDAPWVMPSPNMPTLDTALVYPGGCLLEGCNLSEGRGTTRPFETVGAPFIDGWQLCASLNNLQLPGVYFRPLEFQPTFQKHKGELCQGCFVHVPDPRSFEPVLTYVAILQECRRQCGEALRWNPPPYEYETEKLPIDILAGNGWLRTAIDELSDIYEIRQRMLLECSEFASYRNEALLYPSGA